MPWPEPSRTVWAALAVLAWLGICLQAWRGWRAGRVTAAGADHLPVAYASQGGQARAIAAAAGDCADGVLDVTNRANLQIRGVRAGCEDALIERLLAAGLGIRATARHAGCSTTTVLKIRATLAG